MNQQLDRLASELQLSDPRNEALRLAFCGACGNRVRHLLEDPRAVACLDVLLAFVAGQAPREVFAQAQRDIAAIANSHRGSPSIDGTDHAAVSATYAVANALAGKALDAASYAAYAIVYAYGRYAVSDPSAFEGEFAWAVQTLTDLARQHATLNSACANPA